MAQIDWRRAEMAQIVVDAAIRQRDRETTRVSDDENGSEADDGDEDEDHHKDGVSLEHVGVVEDAESWHELPVRTEIGAVAVVVADAGFFRKLRIYPVFAGLSDLTRPHDRIPGVHKLHLWPGSVDDGVKERVGEIVGLVNIGNVEGDEVFQPFAGEPGSHARVVTVVEDIMAEQAVVREGLGDGDREFLAGDEIRHQRHVFRELVVVKAVAVVNRRDRSWLDIHVHASEGAIAALGEKQIRLILFSVDHFIGRAEGGLCLLLVLAVDSQPRHWRFAKSMLHFLDSSARARMSSSSGMAVWSLR